ncbi:MAG: hypothetical protein WCK09_09725 [Bacteroidota bacterium]
MKTLKTFILIFALTGILVTGCKKSEVVTPEPAKTLNDLKASPTFGWSTGSPVELKITGIPTIVPIKSTLTISRTSGETLFSSLHQMDQNLTIKLTVPSTEKELTLKYGSVSYPVAIVNHQAGFSFIPVIAE